MSERSELHWERVHDYLLDVCASRQSCDFYQRSIAGIDRLIGCSCATAVVSESGDPVGAMVSARAVATTAGASVLDRFNTHFRYLAPPLSPEIFAQCTSDFTQFEHAPYVAEFIRPNGWWRSAWIPGGPYLVSLFRSRGEPAFSDRDLKTLQIITRHLSNHYGVLSATEHALRPAITAAELTPGAAPLTRREIEIIRCLTRRMTARETADFLGISPRTVERHIANMYEKLDVHSRQSLVRLVLGTGPTA